MRTLLPPPPEQGIHFEIFRNALRLKGKGLTANDAERELHRWKSENTFRPGRDVTVIVGPTVVDVEKAVARFALLGY